MTNDILAYYQQLSDGSVTVGKWIRLIYSYIVKGLEDRSFYFAPKKAARAVKFVEAFCHHSKGRNDLIKLELWQRAMISVIFGIVDENGMRVFREAVIVVARKNGKSLLAAAIMACMLFIDGEYGAEIYCVAPKLDQAEIVYSSFIKAIEPEPELWSLVRPRKSDFYMESTNSLVKKIAFNSKKSDGYNPSLTVCDEIASWPGDQGLKQYEVMRSAIGARTQPLIVSISTAGYMNEGIYDELMRRSTRFLLGDSKEKRLLPFLYTIDDPEKWNDLNELAKSNPNLGVSVSVDNLLEEIAVAEGSPSKKVEFLTKYCNVKMNSSLAWLSSRDVEKAFGWKRSIGEFRNTYALGGIDLSQTTDLTSACVLVEQEGVIWIWSHFWLPGERLEEATQRDQVPYQIYIDKGWLSLSGDQFIDYHDVFNWFQELVRVHKVFPLQVGYDRYTAQYLVQDMEKASFHMESVFQGFNLTGIEDNFEGMLRECKIRCADDNQLLKIHFLDAAQQIESGTSAHSRKKLVKISKYAHVDGVAAILDAMCMRQNHWSTLGKRLMNAG